jgi:hypothetical protein
VLFTEHAVLLFGMPDNGNVTIDTNAYATPFCAILQNGAMWLHDSNMFKIFSRELKFDNQVLQNGIPLYESTNFGLNWKSNLGKHMIDELLNAHVCLLIQDSKYSMTKV